MKIYRLPFVYFLLFSLFLNAANEKVKLPQLTIFTKTAGNPALAFPVKFAADLSTQSNCKNVECKMSINKIDNSRSTYSLTIKAKEDLNFHCSMNFQLSDIIHADADFLLPGLWYKQNLKISSGAPSMSISKSWMFREDRLSTPMVGVYSPQNKKYYSLRHTNKLVNESLLSYSNGEVLMFEESDLGSVGFGENNKKAYLGCTYPVAEYPKSYTHKLQLTNPITVFHNLKKNETIVLTYEFTSGVADTYSDFVRDLWQYAYDSSKPEPIIPKYTPEQVKKYLSEYYKESYTDTFALKGYSGVHVSIDKCEKRGILEVGFIGRIFLNAFYALQYGEKNNDSLLINNAKAIFDSYLKNGFTSNGFIREKVDFKNNQELNEFSIRRQSEGAMALMYYLKYEKSKGRIHAEWETKIENLLKNILALQREDFSFPRKFNDKMEVLDSTGGSSSCTVLPLTMAYKYFDNSTYLNAAIQVGEYIKKENVDKGDYFSSTLDARCEDKEASIYTTTAFYYLWLSTDNPKYIDYASQSVYFSLSYYYTWDVPFAKGQMLGDLGFKTRGWGTVSVENNHIDAYIFDFIDVINWLTKHNGDNRLEAFGKVIASSLQDQLLPVEGRLCGVAKPGYYPEVVQQTTWDYGFNGKGYYNSLFGPGWVVASLWSMLSPGYSEGFFKTGNSLSQQIK